MQRATALKSLVTQNQPQQFDRPSDKALFLVRQGVSIRGAAHAAGLSPSTVSALVRRADADRAATGPFEPNSAIPPPAPPGAWATDQPPPASTEFRRGYHDQTFRSFSAPLAFDGWSLPRVRMAISMHRQGIFLESSTLCYVIGSFSPVLAALAQRMAPALICPKIIKGGSRGLARMVRKEVEAQIAPAEGLSPSIYFPSTNWGQIGFELAFMGFSVLQHVYGDPDPMTGIRPVFTRPWPTWATQYYRYRKTYVAITNSGPVDILNDGKFTIIQDTPESHLLGPIVALGEESFDAKATQRARASYIDKYGNPKWIAEMPPGVGPATAEGAAMAAALAQVRNPDGYAITPSGSKVSIQGLESGRSVAMQSALESNLMLVALALVGNDGTITRGSGGVYSAPIFAGVRRDLVDRDIHAIIRGVNVGHVLPYTRFNYGATAEAERPSWEDPALDIPLPDPDADARMKSYADRLLNRSKIITEMRLSGIIVTQEKFDEISVALDLPKAALRDPKGEQIPNVGTTDMKPGSDPAATVNEDVAAEPAEPERATVGGADPNSDPDDDDDAEDGDDALASSATGGGGSTAGGETKRSRQAPG